MKRSKYSVTNSVFYIFEFVWLAAMRRCWSWKQDGISKEDARTGEMEPGAWVGILWMGSWVQKYTSTAGATAIINGKKICLNDAVLTPDWSYRFLHNVSDASVGTMCSSLGWMHNYYFLVSPICKKHPCALACKSFVAFGKDQLSCPQLKSLSKYCVTVWINLYPSSEL